MLGECKNFSACHSCWFGLVNPQRLLLECFSSSVPFFLLWIPSFFFFFLFPFLSSFYLMINFLVLFHFWGGKTDWFVFFSPPIPFTRPPPPPKRFVFGSVLCFCALWFQFLGLSCFVVVLQAHCDSKASVPVPATIQKGGKSPTAGMLGQKVTAWAPGYKGSGRDRWREFRAQVGCEESSPICLT